MRKSTFVQPGSRSDTTRCADSIASTSAVPISACAIAGVQSQRSQQSQRLRFESSRAPALVGGSLGGLKTHKSVGPTSKTIAAATEQMSQDIDADEIERVLRAAKETLDKGKDLRSCAPSGLAAIVIACPCQTQYCISLMHVSTSARTRLPTFSACICQWPAHRVASECVGPICGHQRFCIEPVAAPGSAAPATSAAETAAAIVCRLAGALSALGGICGRRESRRRHAASSAATATTTGRFFAWCPIG